MEAVFLFSPQNYHIILLFSASYVNSTLSLLARESSVAEDLFTFAIFEVLKL